MSDATGPTVVHVDAKVVPAPIARARLLRLLENAKLASPAPVVMKLQLAGKLAVTSIVPGVTSVTVTVFPAMMPHGFEHSSEFCAALKVSALAPAGAPTLRARANPAAASAPVSFDFIIASLVWLTTYDPEQKASPIAANGSTTFFGRDANRA